MLRKLHHKFMGNCSPSTPEFSKKKYVKNSPEEKGDGLNAWSEITQNGQHPGECSGHGVVVIDRTAYLFGGCGENGVCKNSFYCFDFEARHWKRIPFDGRGPVPRASFGFSLGPTKGSIIVSGGTAPEQLPGDIFEYNVYTRMWNELFFFEGYEIALKFLSAYGHSLLSLPNDSRGRQMIGFGGSNGTDYANITVKMDFDKMTCEELITTGDIPTPRYKHEAIIVADKMYVIGGGNFRPQTDHIDTYSLGLHTLEWTKHAPTGTLPSSRAAHCCNYDEFSNKIFMWGGFSKDLKRLNDFHTLNLSTMSWSEIKPDGGVPNRRAFFATAFYDSTIFIFGGADGTKRFSDMWAYQLRQSPPTLTVLAARSPAITPLATPIATPQRSRRSSFSSKGKGRRRSAFLNSADGHSNSPAFVTPEAVMAALGGEIQSPGQRNQPKALLKTKERSSRRIAPSKGTLKSDHREMRSSTPESFVIPAEGLLPAEVLAGIQNIQLGMNTFSHGQQQGSPSPPTFRHQQGVPYA